MRRLVNVLDTEQPDPIEILAAEIRATAFSDAHAFAARGTARVLARHAVRALADAGFVIVPREFPGTNSVDADLYKRWVERYATKAG